MLDGNKFKSELARIFKLNGLSNMLNIEKADLLLSLTERMLEENEKYNLTAITDPDKIILNHYADCAILAKELPCNCRVADIGCGAGFPSLIIAILRSDINVLAIDSTEKRVGYVRESARLLGLTNIECKTMRAEDGGRLAEYREKFDIATARAVAELRILCELCLPYVKVGGSFIAMKGKNAIYELKDAKGAIARLGGGDASCVEYSLTNGSDESLSRPLVRIAKKTRTPEIYPRMYSKISKSPL